MPRYYFDFDDDADGPDDTGVELPDLATAVAEARNTAAEIVGEQARQGLFQTIAISIREGSRPAATVTISWDQTVEP